MPNVWHFFHVSKCSHTHPPKDKFVLIVCADSECRGFLVNSDISGFIQKRADMLACQVEIKKSDYYFLVKDSYLDCSQLYPFDDMELLNGRGAVTQGTKAAIKKAVSVAKTIEKRYQDLISDG